MRKKSSFVFGIIFFILDTRNPPMWPPGILKGSKMEVVFFDIKILEELFFNGNNQKKGRGLNKNSIFSPLSFYYWLHMYIFTFTITFCICSNENTWELFFTHYNHISRDRGRDTGGIFITKGCLIFILFRCNFFFLPPRGGIWGGDEKERGALSSLYSPKLF